MSETVLETVVEAVSVPKMTAMTTTITVMEAPFLLLDDQSVPQSPAPIEYAPPRTSRVFEEAPAIAQSSRLLITSLVVVANLMQVR